MKDAQLPINRKKHLIYSGHASRTIRRKLARDYGPKRGEAFWEEAQRKYAEFLKDAPDVGGRKNPHARGIYDAILFFSYYAALPEKPPMEELQKLTAEIFMSGFEKSGRFFNLNRKSHLALAAKIFEAVGKQDAALIGRYPDSFRMETEPFDEKAGVIRYRFTQCPNAVFAQKHGFAHLMPLLCNCDYIGLGDIRGGLIRTDTLARGSVCDYRVMGDENPLLRKHPRTIDSRGFWCNA